MLDCLKSLFGLTTKPKPSNPAGGAAAAYMIGPEPAPVAPGTPLYVMLPYFNYCFFRRRKELFIEFVQRMSSVPHIRMVVIEAVEKGEHCQLQKESLTGIFLHLKVETAHRIWLKENLINLGVAHLPPDWKVMAWIDADLTFLNPDWAVETLRVLHHAPEYDVVQMFERCINLGPTGEPMKTDKGFGYMFRTSGKPYTKTHKYGFWHPGYAWACSRTAYQQMGGLIDWGILGSGDHHMALALIGLADISHPGNIHAHYAERLKAYERRVAGLRLGYIHGDIQHHYHGRLADRRYRERWDILTQNKYDPDTDIYKTINGVIQLTLSGLRLQPEIHDYFIGRQEDRTEE
jgi:hypothetical protein